MSLRSKNLEVLSAHQPNFLPWIGFFSKINQSQVFVFSDDVRYSKQQNINRSYFLDSNGNQFFWRLPVKKKPSGRVYEKTLCYDECRIFEHDISKVRFEYRKTPYFKDLLILLDKVEENFNSIQNLSEFNISCIKLIAQSLEIQSYYLRGSEIGLQNYAANERLLQRAKILEIPNYLCGQGASEYQDDKWLMENGLKIFYVNYSEIGYFGEHAHYSILHLISMFGLENIKHHFINSVYLKN